MKQKLTNFQLYKLLRQNDKLKNKRHPMFEKNKFAKFMGYFMIVYFAGILMLLGATLPLAFESTMRSMAAFHVLDSGFFYLLIVDFWTRFMFQETPAQQIKPYITLPIHKNFITNMYLFRNGLTLGNLFWMFFLVPFALVAILKYYGMAGVLGWLFGYWLLIVANSYIYQFCRTLILKKLIWILLPLVCHAAIVLATILPETNTLGYLFTDWLEQCIFWNPLSWLPQIAVIVIFFLLTRKLQAGMIYKEIGKVEEVVVKNTSDIKFLNKYGAMGEYLKLEIKLRMRNKPVKQQFFIGVAFMVLFSLALAFTSVYDGAFMTSFICMYSFVVLGMMTLVTIMCHEGNYIDGLMSRRESIYSLLCAKYYFNVLLLLVPFFITLIPIFTGKIEFMMSLGYLLFTAGVIYPSIFQMAVYNNSTLPLNAKLTGKQGNWVQQVVSLVAMFVPLMIEKILIVCLGTTGGYAGMCVLGLIGLATHRIWIQNIYQRFMKRRYTNMEGFRSSRQ
ncbi:MAG: DUF5687 family protein [Bacteroidaceae bacterium]|nr:hypothetical protein [Candidatus Minthousia equi]MCQ2247076.1 DUF5687 family protein [Bacteroidaceae bacterium]MDO4955622.1 DUF5687 family protein [Bacteroidales bacterium]